MTVTNILFQLPSNVKNLFRDPRTDPVNLNKTNATAFWVYVAALKRFYSTYEYLPLSGSLPDMTSDTKSYTHLVQLFNAQADKEAQEVLDFSLQILNEADLEFQQSELSFKDCRELCKNATRLDIQTGSDIEEKLEGKLEVRR